jgi:hypothetical protein
MGARGGTATGGGACGAGSAARELGKARDHTGRGGEGGLSPRRLVGGEAAEE